VAILTDCHSFFVGKDGVTMNIIEMYMTKNRCFTQDRRIKPKGVMVHSDACKAGIKARDWFKRWNNLVCSKAVHFFVDDVEAVKYLHAEKDHVTRGWHCAGKGNDMFVAFEMSEPKDYYDKAYFNKVYANAVELTAILLRDVVGTTTVNEDTVLCHQEGYRKGLASNHADVFHYFSKQGKDMDDFRKDVKAKLTSMETKVEKPKVEVKPTEEVVKYSYEFYVTKSGDTLGKIAARYKTTTDILAKLNNIKNPNSIGVGVKLMVASYRLHTVVKGDTLYNLSNKYLDDPNRFNEIKELNNLKSNSLSLGQILRIPNK
jgi:N-acetylmuramoyl-L-alanine amidase